MRETIHCCCRIGVLSCMAASTAVADTAWTTSGTVSAQAQLPLEAPATDVDQTGWGWGAAYLNLSNSLGTASATGESSITANPGSSVTAEFRAAGSADSPGNIASATGTVDQAFVLTATTPLVLELRLMVTTMVGPGQQGPYSSWSVKVDGQSYGESGSPGHRISLAAGVHEVRFQAMTHVTSTGHPKSGSLILNTEMLVTPLPVADLNADGEVNGIDLLGVLNLWGTSGQGVVDADLNDDGTVNAQDMGIVLCSWGPNP